MDAQSVYGVDECDRRNDGEYQCEPGVAFDDARGDRYREGHVGYDVGGQEAGNYDDEAFGRSGYEYQRQQSNGNDWVKRGHYEAFPNISAVSEGSDQRGEASEEHVDDG